MQHVGPVVPPHKQSYVWGEAGITAMGEASGETSVRASSVPRPVVAMLAGVVVALIAATAAMWFHYGTAVFYEIIAAGIAMCF